MWSGRRFHTDDGEHGVILSHYLMARRLRRMSRRRLVRLILAKDYLELVRWSDGKVELVRDDYLADEGTHLGAWTERPLWRDRLSMPSWRSWATLTLCAVLVFVGAWTLPALGHEDLRARHQWQLPPTIIQQSVSIVSGSPAATRHSQLSNQPDADADDQPNPALFRRSDLWP